MHYSNGREAKVGDTIIAKNYAGVPYTAVVMGINPGSETCNLHIQMVDPLHSMSCTAKEAIHVDDFNRPVPAAPPAPSVPIAIILALLFLGGSVAMAQDTNSVAATVPVVDPNNPLGWLVLLIGGAAATKIFAALGAWRLAMRPFTMKLQEFLEDLIAFVKGSKSESDDHILERIIDNPIYQSIAFLADYLFSIKLPRTFDERTDGVTPTAAPVAAGVKVAAAVSAAAGLAFMVMSLTGCGTLNKDGVYHGDKVVYAADQTILTAYDTIHVFVKWEYQSRAILKDHPEISKAADDIRDRAGRLIQSAIAVRDAYESAPVDSNRQALDQALAALQEAAAQAASYITLTFPDSSSKGTKSSNATK